MATARSAAFLVILCACSDAAAPRDAAIDVDNGTCTGMLRFTGEYLDWDSGATFCGVFGAQFQVEGGSAKSTTAPNGRFDLCVPDAATTLVDITPPSAASQCTQDPETYVMPGIAVARKDVIAAAGMWSGRAFGMARQAVDPTKAQVFVHVNGTPRAVSITAAHGTAQARNNDAWAAGDTGADVYFPDVDPAGGSTTLSAGSAIGTGTIPLVAGKMTEISIIGN